MQKLNELMYAYLPETAFLAFSIRLAVYGASIGDALALLVAASLIGYKRFLSKKKLEDFEVIQGQFKLLDETRIQDIKTLQEEIAGLRNSINALKIDKAFQLNKKVNLEQETPQQQPTPNLKRLF